MNKASAAKIPECKTEDSRIPFWKIFPKIEGKLENSDAERDSGFASAYCLTYKVRLNTHGNYFHPSPAG